MKTTYFITVNGVTLFRNLTKEKAIETAKKQSGNIGIGKYKTSQGKRVYTLLHLQYFI